MEIKSHKRMSGKKDEVKHKGETKKILVSCRVFWTLEGVFQTLVLSDLKVSLCGDERPNSIGKATILKILSNFWTTPINLIWNITGEVNDGVTKAPDGRVLVSRKSLTKISKDTCSSIFKDACLLLEPLNGPAPVSRQVLEVILGCSTPCRKTRKKAEVRIMLPTSDTKCSVCVHTFVPAWPGTSHTGSSVCCPYCCFGASKLRRKKPHKVLHKVRQCLSVRTFSQRCN